MASDDTNTAAATDPERLRIIGGRYVLRRLLGKGGMGEVWLAHHPRLNLPVAIKILGRDVAERSPDFVQRFIQEARLAVQLNHPGIVRVYDADNDAECHYIVMEYVDGCTAVELADRRGGSLPAAEAVDLMIRIAEALKEAVRLHIIHRDIKPENILIAADGGGAKLADLGIAKQLGAATDNVTGTGTTIGTPGYISPEQAMNSDKVDFRSDIYSLGATFYRLVTGDLPFLASGALNVMMMHAMEPLPHPRTRKPELPDNVCAVICKMMEKRPENRYPSYDALLEDLNKIKFKNAPVRELHASAVMDSLVVPKLRTGPVPAKAAEPGSGNLLRRFAWAAAVVAAVVLGLAGSQFVAKSCSTSAPTTGTVSHPAPVSSYGSGRRAGISQASTGAVKQGGVTMVSKLTIRALAAGLGLAAVAHAGESKLDVMRKARTEKLASVESEAQEKRKVVNDAYLKQLGDLKTALTKTGDLEGGLAVAKEIENVDTEFAHFGGHRYKLIKENCSWTEARRNCVVMGGYLACVNSKEEWMFLLAILQSAGNGTCAWGGGSFTKKGVEFLDGSALPWAEAVKLVHWYGGDPLKRFEKIDRSDTRRLLLHTDGYHEGPGWDLWPEAQKAPELYFICEWDK